MKKKLTFLQILGPINLLEKETQTVLMIAIISKRNSNKKLLIIEVHWN